MNLTNICVKINADCQKNSLIIALALAGEAAGIGGAQVLVGVGMGSDAQPLRGLLGALAYLAIIAAGGLILGSVTGISLMRLLREETPA